MLNFKFGCLFISFSNMIYKIFATCCIYFYVSLLPSLKWILSKKIIFFDNLIICHFQTWNPRTRTKKIVSVWPTLTNLQEVGHMQEEAKNQELEDREAAMAVAKRQRMLESEKENIEKKPFMDIKIETKRFRQDVFKRRHRARAVEKHNSTVSST